MTPTEAVLLTEYVRACCPQQHIGEYTPDAWHDLLHDLQLSDCKEAAANVARRQPFVSPSEIRTEVRRIRSERIERSTVEAPPPDLLDNPRAYQRALQANIRKAADGLAPPVERAALPPGEETMRLTGTPVSLRGAIAEFRRRYTTRHRPRAITSGPELARKQLEESRGEADDGNAGGREAS